MLLKHQLHRTSRNCAVKRRHYTVKITLVFFKTTNVNAEVKLNLSKDWHQNVCKKKIPIQHEFEERIDKSVPRRCLVMPNSDLRDKPIYPIHKLMIDSYILAYLMRNYKSIQDFGQGQKYCSDPDVLTLLF